MIDLHQPLPGKRPGTITPVGYLGIGMGVVLILTGLYGGLQSPDTVGTGLFVALIGAAAVYICYMGVRR
jgi:hypothetical protein